MRKKIEKRGDRGDRGEKWWERVDRIHGNELEVDVEDGRYDYYRDEAFESGDPRTRCGADGYWMELDPGDAYWPVDTCPDGSRSWTVEFGDSQPPPVPEPRVEIEGRRFVKPQESIPLSARTRFGGGIHEWSSSHEKVGEVSADGQVTGRARGVSEILAQSANTAASARWNVVTCEQDVALLLKNPTGTNPVGRSQDRDDGSAPPFLGPSEERFLRGDRLDAYLCVSPTVTPRPYDLFLAVEGPSGMLWLTSKGKLKPGHWPQPFRRSWTPPKEGLVGERVCSMGFSAEWNPGAYHWSTLLAPEGSSPVYQDAVEMVLGPAPT